MNGLHDIREQALVDPVLANVNVAALAAARTGATTTVKLASKRSSTEPFSVFIMLFAALWSSTVPAGTEPPIPSTVTAQFVADKMATNGLPRTGYGVRVQADSAVHLNANPKHRPPFGYLQHRRTFSHQSRNLIIDKESS